ncbi:MAG: hypothetical protein QM500_04910 [Methylococcales bacterium]
MTELQQSYTRLKDIPSFTRSAGYKVNTSWKYIEDWIDDQSEIGLNLDPDFQRAHVWTELQQIRYVEFRLRKGMSGRDIYFNQPGWNDLCATGGDFVMVDGKQRLNAVRRFMNNEIPAFGTVLCDFEDSDRFSLTSADFIIHVNDLKTKAEVYQWYIDLNAGGVAHTNEEIQKVQDMLTNELNMPIS